MSYAPFEPIQNINIVNLNCYCHYDSQILNKNCFSCVSNGYASPYCAQCTFLKNKYNKYIIFKCKSCNFNTCCKCIRQNTCGNCNSSTNICKKCNTAGMKCSYCNANGCTKCLFYNDYKERAECKYNVGCQPYRSKPFFMTKSFFMSKYRK